MAGTGGRRGGASRQAGGSALDQRRDANVRQLLSASAGAAAGVNSIRATGRATQQLARIAQDKRIKPDLRRIVRLEVNRRQLNQRIDATNAFFRGRSTYTPRQLRAAVGVRSLRQLRNSVATMQRAKDYLSRKRQTPASAINRGRPLTARGRAAVARADMRRNAQNNIRRRR